MQRYLDLTADGVCLFWGLKCLLMKLRRSQIQVLDSLKSSFLLTIKLYKRFSLMNQFYIFVNLTCEVWIVRSKLQTFSRFFLSFRFLNDLPVLRLQLI